MSELPGNDHDTDPAALDELQRAFADVPDDTISGLRDHDIDERKRMTRVFGREARIDEDIHSGFGHSVSSPDECPAGQRGVDRPRDTRWS